MDFCNYWREGKRFQGQFYNVLSARESRIEHCGLLKHVERTLLVLIDLGWSAEALQHDKQKVPDRTN